MPNFKKEIFQSLKTLALALVLSVGVSYVYAWGPPAGVPSAENNTPAPVNVGSTTQVKKGGLGVNDLLADRLCLGIECITIWPLPSGAVVYFNLLTCPSGWSSYASAQGRNIIGLKPTDTSFDVLNETGGEKNHTLSIAEMPSHTHVEKLAQINITTGDDYGPGLGARYIASIAGTTGATGSGGAHNVLDPYITLLACVKN
ncbi:MAG: hypothetical protein AAB488_01805 [Patescibacteria group bacterium]